MQFQSVVFEPAGCKCVAVGFPIGLKTPLAFCGPDQGAKFARERQPVHRDPPAACRIAQHDATPFDHETIDRELVRIESAGVFRPIDLSIAIEPDLDFRGAQAQLRSSPMRAQQRTEAELDRELAGTHMRRVRVPADPGLDVFEHQRGRWQQPRIDGAGDPHPHAGEPACLGLEGRAVLAPIDEMRPYQRRQERQDEGNAY